MADSTEVRPLVEGRSICRDCIGFERIVVMGDTTGPGYVEWSNAVVRDSLGRFWAGQRDVLKVFDSAGTFLRQVGRAGQGPMEFVRPKPTYTDAEGKIHVLDQANLRATVIRPNFVLHAEHRLPGGFERAVPLQDGRRYVLNTLLWSPDQVGMPLHVVEGSDVLYSFGVSGDDGTPPISSFTARRVLATDRRGHIFSAPYYDYFIEVWSAVGRRITGFRGPALNKKRPLPGGFSDENPPPNLISAMFIDAGDRLWVMSWRVRTDWRARTVEVMYPDGTLELRPRDDSPRSIWTTRFDVIDLHNASIIASTDREEVINSIVGDGLGLETQYQATGLPQLAVWRFTLLEHERERRGAQ